MSERLKGSDDDNAKSSFLAEMIDLEHKFEVLEGEMKEINANKETLKRNLLDLIELQHILKKTQVFFHEVCTMHKRKSTSYQLSSLSPNKGPGDKERASDGLVFLFSACLSIWVPFTSIEWRESPFHNNM